MRWGMSMWRLAVKSDCRAGLSWYPWPAYVRYRYRGCDVVFMRQNASKAALACQSSWCLAFKGL